MCRKLFEEMRGTEYEEINGNEFEEMCENEFKKTYVGIYI